MFGVTPNNMPDLLCLSKDRIKSITDSTIAVLGADEKSVQLVNEAIGEDCGITKSVIGLNVKIGAETKIANSVILGNCTIGSKCVI